MTSHSNKAESIHQRLLNRAVAERRTFNELLQFYANERFLYRLGRSQYRKQLVLKGGLVFLAWATPFTRPTRDMDFLGYLKSSIDDLVVIVREICVQQCENDGMIFDSASVLGENNQENEPYQGVRIRFIGFLGKAKVNMRMDIGFADLVTPNPGEMELPTIFEEMAKPCVRAYPPESVVSEKFHAMVDFGIANSRMKDFFDVWFMASTMTFDYSTLNSAVINTFRHRNTSLPEDYPTALTDAFAAQKQSLWTNYIRKNELKNAPGEMNEIVSRLRDFFHPIIFKKKESPTIWTNESGWKS